jgi:hypothetical protein
MVLGLTREDEVNKIKKGRAYVVKVIVVVPVTVLNQGPHWVGAAVIVNVTGAHVSVRVVVGA